MTLTDASRANKSGTKLEEQVESFLKQNNFAYTRQKPGAAEIDFIIPSKGNQSIYADCTNQMVNGSVYDKVPHKIWKYWVKYEYNEVYIIRGTELPPVSVRKHIEWFEKTTGVVTHIVDIEEFNKIMMGKDPHQGPLDVFFK